MMKKSGIMQQTELLNNGQGYHIRLGEESTNGQRKTQTKIGRQDALLEMKSSKSQYAITQSQKQEEDPDVFYIDDYKKDHNPIHSQIEEEEVATSIKNLCIANLRDLQEQQYYQKQFQKYKEKNEVAKNEKKYKRNKIPPKAQLSKKQKFQEIVKQRKDYQGVIEDEINGLVVKYYVSFLQRSKIYKDYALYLDFKAQVEKGKFVTQHQGQNGVKILGYRKHSTMYQIKIPRQQRLIGHLFQFKQVNLIVFERYEIKSKVEHVINKLDKYMHVKDLKEQIYNEIKEALKQKQKDALKLNQEEE